MNQNLLISTPRICTYSSIQTRLCMFRIRNHPCVFSFSLKWPQAVWLELPLSVESDTVLGAHPCFSQVSLPSTRAADGTCFISPQHLKTTFQTQQEKLQFAMQFLKRSKSHSTESTGCVFHSVEYGGTLNSTRVCWVIQQRFLFSWSISCSHLYQTCCCCSRMLTVS